jgi:hypothetical protein
MLDLPTLSYKDLRAQIGRRRYCTTEVTTEIHMQTLCYQDSITLHRAKATVKD